MSVLADVVLLIVVAAVAVVTRSVALYYIAGGLFVLGLFARWPSRRRQ